jgi:hypothetical protein
VGQKKAHLSLCFGNANLYSHFKVSDLKNNNLGCTSQFISKNNNNKQPKSCGSNEFMLIEYGCFIFYNGIQY